MVPVPSEKAEVVSMAVGEALPASGLQQVQCIASDAASAKLWTQLRRVMPGLQCMMLDPVHLPIVYEQLCLLSSPYHVRSVRVYGRVTSW